MLEVANERKRVESVPRHLPRRTTAPLIWGYFAASIAIVVAGVFALDRWIIPSLENSGQLESYLWADENHRLNHFTYLKNDARKENPVWRSQYIPVLPEHSGKKRILVVGDSFVWGDGSNNVNDLWWRQLGQELERRGYENVDVIAAGLNGSSTHDEAAWLPSLIAKYKPDLIIFGYVTNDPDEKDEHGRPFVKMLSKEFDDKDPILAKLKDVLPNLTGQLRQIRKMARQAQGRNTSDSLEYADWELAMLQGVNLKAYAKTVADLGSYLRAEKVPAFVMTLPAGFQNKTRENTANRDDFFERVRTYNAERYAKVKPIFAEAGLPFIDTADDFAQKAASDPLLKSNHSALRLGINPGNGHPGPFSTHYYAVKAADELQKDYASFLGEKTAAHKSERVVINDCMPPYMNVSADQNEANSFQFMYPPDLTDHTLYLPLRKKHVQLSLAEPVAVQKIEISGENLASAQIFPSYFDDKLSYAPGEFAALEQKKGKHLTFAIDGSRKLYALKLRAHFTGSNQLLKVKFDKP